jgi:hypothetical protein
MYVRPVVALDCAHMCTVLPISKALPQFWNVLPCPSSLQVEDLMLHVMLVAVTTVRLPEAVDVSPHPVTCHA